MTPIARRERDLSDEQNEHVRRLVRRLLDRETQTSLGPKIGMRQNSLSGFLAGRQGTSYAAARRVAQLAGVDLEDLLAGRPTTPDPYPTRARALSALAASAHPAAVAYVRTLEIPPTDPPPTEIEWARILAHWDAEARAGRLR